MNSDERDRRGRGIWAQIRRWLNREKDPWLKFIGSMNEDLTELRDMPINFSIQRCIIYEGIRYSMVLSRQEDDVAHSTSGQEGTET